MKKDKKEPKKLKLRVLGRLKADEISKEVLEQARGGLPPKASHSLPPTEIPDTGP